MYIKKNVLDIKIVLPIVLSSRYQVKIFFGYTECLNKAERLLTLLF